MLGPMGDQAPIDDVGRKAALLRSVLATMFAMGGLGLGAAVLDRRNDLRVTLGFYAAVFLALGALAALVRRRKVIVAGWIVTLFFWVLIAFVTMFFGGLQGENAATFCVAVLLIGIVVSGRVAVGLAVASSIWCGIVAFLEVRGWLPRQLGPYSPINAWSALTVTLVLTSVLLQTALRSLQETNARERAAAAARDEALRRSIEAQKLEVVGALTAAIAHDFNNLLTIIAGAAEHLDGERLDPEAREVVDDLRDAATRARLLTRQLHGQVRRAESEPEPLALDALVRASAAMLPRLVGAKVAVEVTAEPDCWIAGTRAGIEQILLNLAVNARDAMPSGGRLRIDVRGDGDQVLWTISDTGVGMEPDVAARAFEPFFTTKPTGTGLGLATVGEVVARFGGRVEIDSGPGRGTSFLLRFPRVPAAAAAPAEVPVESRRPGRGRLLLAEDDPAVRRTLVRVLERAGYDVVAVADGEEAKALVAHPFVAVVTDCAMPRLGGEALARHLAEVRPSLPVLLLSGEVLPDPSVLRAPRRSFVKKPPEARALIATLQALIEGRESGTG